MQLLIASVVALPLPPQLALHPGNLATDSYHFFVNQLQMR